MYRDGEKEPHILGLGIIARMTHQDTERKTEGIGFYILSAHTLLVV